MLSGSRGDGPSEVAGGVALGPDGGCRITKDLTAVLLGPVCCFECALGLGSPQHRQQFRCGDGPDGPVSQPGKDPERDVWG